MKALTVRQPWAELIVAGRKPQEFRPWRPPVVPLRLCIHAAAELDRSPEALAAIRAYGLDLDLLETATGVLVGEIYVVRTRLVSQLHPMARYGRIAWELAEPARYRELIPARGRLGLWDVDAGIAEAL